MSNFSSPNSSEDESPSFHKLRNYPSISSTLCTRAQVYPLRPIRKSLNSCSMCSSKYNTTTILPLLLPSCGHTFCRQCLGKMSCSTMIRCLICSSITYKKLSKLPVNYALLEVCESRNKKPVCKEHNLELIAFCFNDDALLCGRCTLSHRSHKIFAMTDPEIQKIANSKRGNLELEEEELCNLLSTWKKIKEEYSEGLSDLKSCVRKHTTQLHDMENSMIKKVSSGTIRCLKELESIKGNEFEVINHKVRQGVENIRTRLDAIREIIENFYEMSVVEKLIKAKVSEEIAKEPPPSLDFADGIIEILKGKVDYEHCIKEKKLIIN